MNSDKLVSIVIATHNTGKYLHEAICSVINQTYKNIEIHIVDDGSTDDTCNVVKDYLSDKRVNYYYQENSGQAKTKNRGITESKGDYIAFLDADDIWMHDKLEKQLPCFEHGDNIGVVYTRLVMIDENGKELYVPAARGPDGRITSQLLIENIVTGMTSIVRRECFDKYGLFDETLSMGIDYDLWLRFSIGYNYLLFDEVTYKYRIWPGQMSHNWKKRFECGKYIMERFINEHKEILDERIVNEAWAHTYVGQGSALARIEKDKVSAIKSYATALKYKPTYTYAWKEILKLFIY